MFLEKDDLKNSIRLYKLDQILDDDTDDEILNDVLQTAEQTVKDYLYQHYDTETIFAQAGTDRKKNVLLWTRYIALYQLYERIPDEMVPERVVKNYDDTIALLNKLSEGQIPVELPRKTVTDSTGTETPKTKFIWGSQPARSY